MSEVNIESDIDKHVFKSLTKSFFFCRTKPGTKRQGRVGILNCFCGWYTLATAVGYDWIAFVVLKLISLSVRSPRRYSEKSLLEAIAELTPEFPFVWLRHQYGRRQLNIKAVLKNPLNVLHCSFWIFFNASKKEATCSVLSFVTFIWSWTKLYVARLRQIHFRDVVESSHWTECSSLRDFLQLCLFSKKFGKGRH